MSDDPRQTLRCPHCGAPLPPESLRASVTCAFCGVASAPAQVAPAASGAVLVARETVAAAKTECPRCGLPLYEGRAGEVVMLGCGRCGGVWLDNDAAQRAVRAMDDAVVQLADQASRNAAFSVSLAGAIACPVCRDPLTRTRSPQSGMWIDICQDHGTWFDRYELGVVMDAIKPRANPRASGSYSGAAPDFKEGANNEFLQIAAIAGMGVLAVLGAAAGIGSKS